MALLTEKSGAETILNLVILFSAAVMWADSHVLIILCTKKKKILIERNRISCKMYSSLYMPIKKHGTYNY